MILLQARDGTVVIALRILLWLCWESRPRLLVRLTRCPDLLHFNVDSIHRLHYLLKHPLNIVIRPFLMGWGIDIPRLAFMRCKLLWGLKLGLRWWLLIKGLGLLDS